MGNGGIAAQLYTVRDFWSTPEEAERTLRRVRDIGYRSVELAAITPFTPQQLKAKLDEVGLVACSSHTGFERMQFDLDSVIADHRLWGCEHVGIPSMPARYREGGEQGFRQFAHDASAIGRKLEDAGFNLGYHNHSFEFVRFGKRTGLDIIYDESDAGALKAQIDTYWVQHGGGDVAAWVRRVKGRMPVVHLKDMVIADGGQVFAEVGEGNLNWPAIMDACREAGVRWYVVEQDRTRRDPFESLALSYSNLRAMGLS
jgi:sugar phosphate isomerase/epimerase